MYIFFDTEFTQLSHEAKLISIGLISEKGQKFYAELSDTWRQEDCSDFVRREVLPHLEGGACQMTLAELCLQLGNWLESFEVPISLVTDAPTWDWPWVSYIFYEKQLLPANLELTPELFNPDKSAIASETQEWHFRSHHALDDACTLRLAWLKNQKKNY